MVERAEKNGDVVRVLSGIAIPPEVFSRLDPNEISRSTAAASEKVRAGASNLNTTRLERENGGFLSNWWNERDAKVKNAELNHITAVGELGERTTTLLFINIAVSKKLHDQQMMLLDQQYQLAEQASRLETQNCRILEQQKLLEQQQYDLNEANRGLMEAKGVTAEQAVRLIGCVNRVEAAEKKAEQSNAALAAALSAAVEQGLGKMQAELADVAGACAALQTMVGQKIAALAEGQNGLRDMAAAQVEHFAARLDEIAIGHGRHRDEVAQLVALQGQDVERDLDSAKQQFETAIRSQVVQLAETSRYIDSELQELRADHADQLSRLEGLRKRVAALDEQVAEVLSEVAIRHERHRSEAAQLAAAQGHAVAHGINSAKQQFAADMEALSAQVGETMLNTVAELQRFRTDNCDKLSRLEVQSRKAGLLVRIGGAGMFTCLLLTWGWLAFYR